MTTPITNPRQEIDRAIRDHRTWKSRLRISIETKGKYDQPVEDVRRDDLCMLGTRLASLDAATRSLEDFKHVHRIHADFHRAAASILELARAGKKQEAEIALAPDGEFETLSSRLSEALESLRARMDSKPT